MIVVMQVRDLEANIHSIHHDRLSPLGTQYCI